MFQSDFFPTVKHPPQFRSHSRSANALPGGLPMAATSPGRTLPGSSRPRPAQATGAVPGLSTTTTTPSRSEPCSGSGDRRGSILTLAFTRPQRGSIGSTQRGSSQTAAVLDPADACLADGKAAALLPRDHILEPSAGNGALGLWGDVRGCSLTLNEIDLCGAPPCHRCSYVRGCRHTMAS